MKKEIREIKLVNGEKVCQITTPDERFYGREEKNKETGLPEIKWYPSVTWIKSYYYVSPYLVKWIADKGMTEAERIKKEAGTKGDKIHQATEAIEKGVKIHINETKFLNKETGEIEELSAEEVEAVSSYAKFIDENKPELIANEMTVFSKDEEQYAGTMDRIWAIKQKDGSRQIWIIDLKTSQSIHKDMIIQLSAYSHADIDYKSLGITDNEWNNRKLAIFQAGYTRNKDGYKFTEVPDRYDLLKLAYQTWKEENPEAKPKQKDYPLIIKSKLRSKDKKEVEVKQLKNKK